MRNLERAVLLTLALALASCGAETQSVSSVTDPDDLIPSDTAQFRLELRATATGDDIPFGQIVAIVADGNGQMYVADAMARSILVIDSSGRHHHTIGRRGEGPGEFAGLDALVMLDSRLVALDVRSRRLTSLDTDGTVIADNRGRLWVEATASSRALGVSTRDVGSNPTPSAFSSFIGTLGPLFLSNAQAFQETANSLIGIPLRQFSLRGIAQLGGVVSSGNHLGLRIL